MDIYWRREFFTDDYIIKMNNRPALCCTVHNIIKKIYKGVEYQIFPENQI